MREIVTIAQSTSNAIRSHGFPVLEAGNISFPMGRYILTFEPGSDRASFVLKHRIEGAPLISRLLKEGNARYVCAVSSPISSYRHTHISKTSSQRIRWDENNLGEPPLFTPMIVSAAYCKLRLSDKEDGVHGIWDKQLVTIEKGSRLALGHVVQLRSSILQLLALRPDTNLKDGQFHVEATSEYGFRFEVHLNPKLHTFLQFKREEGIREHIMTHIVTGCLALLQRDLSDDNDDDGGWRSHRNLLAFAEHLEKEGLPHWSDEDFRPEKVSTQLHPHILPQIPDGEES